MAAKWVVIGGALWRRGSKAARWAARHLLRGTRKPKPAPALMMFDSITPKVMPAKAEAVAGYVGGKWPTFAGLEQSHPHAHRLSIAIAADEAADCLDIETGDARPAQAPAWLRAKATTVATPKPVLYTSAAFADGLVKTLAAAGIPRGSYLLWIAHYTKTPHLCGPATCRECQAHADATQFDDRYDGKNLDVSIVRAGFFRGT